MTSALPLPTLAYQSLAPDLSICRVLNGMWQVSGAHGRIQADRAIAQMFDYLDAGLTTWDLADHYGPAEEFIGEFRRQVRDRRGEAALAQIQAFTKWVPRPGAMTRQWVEENVDRSLRRMQTDRLDLLQFHWWDYSNPAYFEALEHLAALQTAGKIHHLALTNFDTERLKLIVDRGIKIISNQVQFSLVDRRPLAKMSQFCQQNGIQLLAYGTLCGGFFAEKYLGQREPARWSMETVSQQKYRNMIQAWGGWDLFQQLLKTMNLIAQKHGVSLANVAVRYVLQQPAVAGAIVGARLSIAEHIQENTQIFGFELDQEDYDRLEPVLTQSQDLMTVIGDCGDEYR